MCILLEQYNALALSSLICSPKLSSFKLNSNTVLSTGLMKAYVYIFQLRS